MTGPTIQVWGLRRTGTNVFQVVLERSTDAQASTDPWKHQVPRKAPDAAAHLVHVKHPYAWLASMRDWWDIDGFDAFVRRFQVAWDARDAVMRAYATRIDSYVARVRGWQAVLPEEKTLVIRYEDVLEDVAGQVQRVADVAGLTLCEDPRLPGNRVTSRGQEKSSEFDPTYYTERRWIEAFTIAELEELAGYMEDTGMRGFFEDTLGYEVDLA